MTHSPYRRPSRTAPSSKPARPSRMPEPNPNPPMPEAGTAEAIVLEVLRLQIQSLVSADERPWRQGIARAQDVWGRELGMSLFARIDETLSAMRLARRSPFRFSNPLCARCACRLCQHEAQFLRVIQEFGRGADCRAEAIAFLLCEANPCIDYLIAARRLAQTLPSLSAR